MHELIIDICEQVYKGPALQVARPGLIKILDAGCGTGGLTKKLEKFGEVVGVDISPIALKPAKKRKLKLIEGSVNSLPFFDGKFDVIVSASVVYHRRVDEKKAMGEFYRVLRFGGKLILILPAFSRAWGSHDEAVHTRKRYTFSEAVSLVESGGFKPIESRYIFSFLFPVFAAKRLAEKMFSNRGRVSDLEIMPRFLNSFLFLLCRVEWKLGGFLKLPFGSSLLVVGEKK